MWTASSLAFIIPTILILTIWLMIAVHLRSTEISGDDKMQTRRRKSFNRITVIMAILTLAFLICWWPYAVIFMMGRAEEEPQLAGALVILAYLNSLINPCLYMVINKDVRNGLKNIIPFPSINFTERYFFYVLM